MHISKSGVSRVLDPFISLLECRLLKIFYVPTRVIVLMVRGAIGANLDAVNAVIARLHPDASADATAAAI